VTHVASCDPAARRPTTAIELASSAIERATGVRPLRCAARLVADFPLLERLGIPVVATGFDVPSGNVHAPNERMRLANLALALASAASSSGVRGAERLRSCDNGRSAADWG